MSTVKIDLSGQWGFRMDRDRVGVSEGWYNQDFSDTIPIPGSMEEAGYGDIPEKVNINDLNHTRDYRGWAWYRTDFTLTETQAAEHLTLIMSRIQWDSRAWVDGRPLGAVTSLAAPHTYDLTGLSAGKHRLTVLVDNSNLRTEPDEAAAGAGKDALGRDMSLHLRADGDRRKLACGIHLAHYSWNGIVGDVCIEVKPRVRIERTSVYTDAARRMARLVVHIANDVGLRGVSRLRASCEHGLSDIPFMLTGEGEQDVTLELHLGERMRLWDEFDPWVYTFSVALTTRAGEDYDIVRCGLRELRAEGRHVTINGRRLFLRATLEGTAFPYTAYTPMDEAFWARAFRILKSYGLNGMRMHSFVPPRAAFEAAEKIGFYFQVELPGTSCPSKDEDPAITAFLWHELKETLKLYGNYACFVFMSMGNEQLVASDRDFLARHQKLLMEKVAYGQKTDPRHLYTCASHPHTEGRNDDFYVVARKDELVLNGIRWGGPDPITTSRFCLQPPSTDADYQEGVERIDAPVITHEVGQWAVYPNFAEMPKYTGVLKPRNYELLAAALDKNGLLHQNADFVKNSGILSLMLYKEEIESALRTPDLTGFELLDIHDYPGQGTSTVGVLDCFFDSKGLITPEGFRAFCAPCTALCAFDRYVYTSGDTMKLTPMVANYGPADVTGEGVLTVAAADGYVLFRESFPVSAKAGGLTKLAPRTALLAAGRATRAAVTFEIPGTGVGNSWDVWVYPAALPALSGGPEVVRALDKRAEDLLRAGGDVLCVLTADAAPENGLPGSFTSQFWNPFMKPQQTRNGLLLDPDHPLFAEFPTESHTNWQWWEILMKSRPVALKALPRDFFPIVQVIPGIKDNEKIGLIWECRTEKGRLLVCAADLFACGGRPAAQLMYALKRYMSGPAFRPARTLTLAQLRAALR